MVRDLNLSCSWLMNSYLSGWDLWFPRESYSELASLGIYSTSFFNVLFSHTILQDVWDHQSTLCIPSQVVGYLIWYR